VHRSGRTLFGSLAFLVLAAGLAAQDKSVRPGINDPFKEPGGVLLALNAR
jgi:hypothetical protein